MDMCSVKEILEVNDASIFRVAVIRVTVSIELVHRAEVGWVAVPPWTVGTMEREVSQFLLLCGHLPSTETDPSTTFHTPRANSREDEATLLLLSIRMGDRLATPVADGFLCTQEP
jgi:hypothetical protein